MNATDAPAAIRRRGLLLVLSSPSGAGKTTITRLLLERDVVTDIDWQGTQQLSQGMPEDLVKVFVLPPSIAALRDRLQRRAQDSAEIVAARMAKSAEEMSHWPEYDYVIVNRDIDESVAEVAAIVTAERRRRTRQLGLAEFVNRLRAG